MRFWNPAARASGLTCLACSLLAAAEGDWLTYSGNLAGWRYSPLAQITTANVARLQPQWLYQFGATHKIETSPLVRDGIMYFTGPVNDVAALDAVTGRRLWHYRYRVPRGT